MGNNEKFKKNDMVFIKDLKIYGIIDKFWNVKNNDKEDINYIIKDQLGIFHERFEDEITKVNNIQDSIRIAKCNLPLETLIELFNQIDKRYTLTIEVSTKKENDHSDIYVPHVFVRYGSLIYDKEHKFCDVACFIRNGELFCPDNPEYIAKDGEYECCLSEYDANLKDVLFELYMEIITRTNRTDIKDKKVLKTIIEENSDAILGKDSSVLTNKETIEFFKKICNFNKKICIFNKKRLYYGVKRR